MQIKQFSADTIDEVLVQVRAELGEDAMILQTKRVVRGGIGGFFGREGVEVTAASAGDAEANREAAASVAVPAPPATPGFDALATDEQDLTPPVAEPAPEPAGEPEREPAPQPAPDPGPVAEEPPAPVPAAEEPFRRHLDSRLAAAEEAEEPFLPLAPAAPAAAYARAGAPFAPGGLERSQAIIEAARAAVREAHEAALTSMDEPAPAEDEPVDEAEMIDEPENLAEPAYAPAPRPAPRPRGTAKPAAAGEGLDAVRAELLRAGVEERYLDPFLDGFSRAAVPYLAPDASVRDALKDHLAARLPVVRDWKPRGAGHAIAMVGQTGVGKTSAAAGMAGAWRAAGLAVALVAAGPGHHDALEGHARRLDVQLFRAADGASLADLCRTLADRDLIVIDTHGRSHQQVDEMEALNALISPAKPDEVHLVMPAATPPSDLGDLQRRFRIAGVNRMVLTKLDETRFLGNLVNVPLRMGKPLAFTSAGAAVPGSLAPADARGIAEALLP